MPDTLVLLVLSVKKAKNLKLFLCLSVLCYFAHWNPRGTVGLRFLDEQLRKIASICCLWKIWMGKCWFTHGQRMDKLCFARDIKEQRTLGSVAAQGSFTPQLVLGSSLLMVCYLAVAIPAIQWTAAQVSSGPVQVGGLLRLCMKILVLHVGPLWGTGKGQWFCLKGHMV